MKSFLAKTNLRMRAKGVVTSLVFAFTVTACSSKQAVVDESNNGDMQAEENLILGEDGGADESDLLVDDAGGEAVGAADTMGDADADNMVVSEDGQVATSVNPDAPSLPVAPPSNSDVVWKGSLKSRFEPGMTEWRVSRGESLALIAGAVYGRTSDWKKLLELNPEITDPNSISVGQVLRLPGSDMAAKAEQVEMTPPATQDADMPVVSNVDTAAPVAEASSSDAAGAMGVVENATPPPAPEVAEAPAVEEAPMNNMVQRVDLSGNKLKLRNILLGVAAFFLLLAGLIFVLSRRKAAKVG